MRHGRKNPCPALLSVPLVFVGSLAGCALPPRYTEHEQRQAMLALSQEDRNNVALHRIWVGMPRAALWMSWGEPRLGIHTSRSPYGLVELWRYGRDSEVTVVDGEVRWWSQSDFEIR